MAQILITGGAGFIGRWLAKKAIQAEHQVWVYDNLSVGSLDNLVQMEGQLQFVEGDILDIDRLKQLMKQECFNVVYHLAAYHYIPFCETHPHLTMRVNVEGTISVLEACCQSNRPHFVFASTGALYPSIDEPLNEDVNLIPVDIYGLSKWMGEQAVCYYHQRYRLPCTVVRLFNTYGPYETNPHLLPHIIQSLKTHRDYVELGNLKPKRDYVYVEDVADALLSVLMPDECLHTFNIGTGKEYSVEEIILFISQILGIDIKIIQISDRIRPVDKMHQRADISRIYSAKGWSPRYDIYTGLKALLRHEYLLSE